MSTSGSVCICMCICICLCLCMFILHHCMCMYMYVCMYVCTHAYIHTHIHVRTLSHTRIQRPIMLATCDLTTTCQSENGMCQGVHAGTYVESALTAFDCLQLAQPTQQAIHTHIYIGSARDWQQRKQKQAVVVVVVVSLLRSFNLGMSFRWYSCRLQCA